MRPRLLLRCTTTLLLLSMSVLVIHAQLGGVLDRVKDKINGANDRVQPVTSRAERAADAFTPWSPDEEEQIGEASAAKMIAMFGTVEQPGLVHYVNLTGAAVAQFAPRHVDYRFGVLNTGMVGAFALPGGFVFITTGAIAQMHDEAELAGVLGHEIMHVSDRDLESEIRSKKTSAWALEESRARSLPGGEALRAKVDALLRDLFNSRLSRGKETDADLRGSRLAAQAGYAQNGLRNFLERLAQTQAEPGHTREFGQLLSTHPPFAERVAALGSLSDTSGKTLELRFAKATQ